MSFSIATVFMAPTLVTLTSCFAVTFVLFPVAISVATFVRLDPAITDEKFPVVSEDVLAVKKIFTIAFIGVFSVTFT